MKKSILWIILIILAAVVLGFFVSRINLSTPGSIKVYFLKDEALSAVERPPGSLAAAAAALAAGPTKEEKEAGYYTEIPQGTKILGAGKKGRIAIIDFNSKLEDYGGGATRIQALIGQIVYTFTEFPGIDEVKITVNGKDEVVLGGEGYVIDKPLSREDINL